MAHTLGKGEVESSILSHSTIKPLISKDVASSVVDSLCAQLGVNDSRTAAQIWHTGTSLPSTMNHQGFHNLLAQMDCPGFLVDEAILQFAQRLVVQELEGKNSWADVRIPLDALRHAQATAIAFPVEGSNGGLKVFVLDERNDRRSGDPESAVYAINEEGPRHLGSFIPGGVSYLRDDLLGRLTDDEAAKFSMVVAAMAFILSIINQPRMLRREPLISRQQRRSAERSGSKSVNCWHRVTWDLSKETAAKISADPSYHKVPLHWRRGHFRRAEAHYKGAVQRPDALRLEERGLWWQWIEGQWVGHPAFGFKRSVHTPKLSTGELAR